MRAGPPCHILGLAEKICNALHPNSQAAIHPGRWERFGRGFGAVFVFGIEFGNGCERLFRHAEWEFMPPLKLSILTHAPNRDFRQSFGWKEAAPASRFSKPAVGSLIIGV